MPRNGSGTMTPDVDFTTEAASPPIEIAKLDEVLDDIADEITNSIAADGQTNPSADLKMNGFKHTNVGAASALNQYGRVQEIIDQDYVYYVDSGAADAYVITPSPAISAYEEGQRFVFRAANANTGASTLNVNSLGAIAIQTPDGSALASGAIVAGGYYEVVYDANSTPDRWVLMSPASEIPDGMLSSNIPLKNADNTFTGRPTVSANTPFYRLHDLNAGTNAKYTLLDGNSGFRVSLLDDDGLNPVNLIDSTRSGTTPSTLVLTATAITLTGAVAAATIAQSTNTTLVAGQVHAIDGNATLPNMTAGQWVTVINNGSSDRTVTKNASDTMYWTATAASVTSVTIPARGAATFICADGTNVYANGNIASAS